MARLEAVLAAGCQTAQAFHKKVLYNSSSEDEQNICKQAFASLLWSKQFYFSDSSQKHKKGISSKISKQHLNCQDVLLVPDKGLTPLFVTWEIAFQLVQYCKLDMNFAKQQILLLLSEPYTRNGQPMQGPPLVAWAVWQLYRRDHQATGITDHIFLVKAFGQLKRIHSWWCFKHQDESFMYGNGSMGFGNHCYLNKSKLPADFESIKQADCTGWMAQFSLMMLKISLDLCKIDNKIYTDPAIKYLKHFLCISFYINKGIDQGGLWCEQDNFFYDVVKYRSGVQEAIKMRSVGGLVPILACGHVSLRGCPGVTEFLMGCHAALAPHVCKIGEDEYFISLVSFRKLKSILNIVFSEEEFLSPYGIRSLSKIHAQPYKVTVNNNTESIVYLPGEPDPARYGGQSNWRGPIWLPMNYLLVECFEEYCYLDDIFTIPLMVHFPADNITTKSFYDISQDISSRITRIFLKKDDGMRPVLGNEKQSDKEDVKQNDKEYISLFHEYFDAETGKGYGSSHNSVTAALFLEFQHKLQTERPHPLTESRDATLARATFGVNSSSGLCFPCDLEKKRSSRAGLDKKKSTPKLFPRGKNL